jgi:hypothetical protein
MEHLTLHKNAEGGKREVLVFSVFLSMCRVSFSVLLLVDVFFAVVVFFGVATLSAF